MAETKKRRGFVLIASYMAIVVLIILGVAFLCSSIAETRIAERERNFVQAVYLAEAGIDYGLTQLRGGTSLGSNSDLLADIGNYNCTWSRITGETNKWEIISTGTVGDINRMVRVEIVKQELPPNFFDNALYVSGEITFNGNAYEVNGNVIYSETLSGDTSYVNGDITHDPSIFPLIALDFSQLRQISGNQGNIYDAFRLKTDSLPNSFWYDEAAGIPNIVYVESDLTLNGNIGTVGGFFVVVGDVITDPSRTQDATINGNGQIAGCIYTTGEFTVNGGGGGLNVNGGVWAGEEVTLNGNANITYNQTFMDAIDNLSLSTEYQVTFWEEL